MRRAVGCMLAALFVFAAAPARADGFFDSLGKAAGLVAPPADPPDFVKDSRSNEDTKPIPVFAPPQEPSSKVKTPAEIKAMDADLEAASGAQKKDAPKRRMRRKRRKRAARP